MSDSRPFFCIIGASGSGKTTVVNEILKSTSLKRVVSYTTREPRENETADDYHFVTPEEFETLTLVGKLSYAGNNYGINAETLHDYDIAVVDPEGAIEIQDYLAEHERRVFIIGMTVPYMERKKRMHQAGRSAEDIKRRTYEDQKVFRFINTVADIIIWNKDLTETACAIVSYITAMTLAGSKEIVRARYYLESGLSTTGA